ncbi:unnamed protein product [Adineta steineri]|uniref:Uncharacterized protein n=2 Tax=Adineta steineri TaxID=433720 RepID=A0A815RYC4_9BILA|nr:unnamed protein product [Adineta steineri]
MIIHEEDYDKANIILTIDNQCCLQAPFDYIIYLCIQLNEVLPYSDISIISTYLLNLYKHPITSRLDTQLNLTFKTQLLNTDESISEDLHRILHTFTTDCFSLKSAQEYHHYQDHIFENEILLLISRY